MADPELQRRRREVEEARESGRPRPQIGESWSRCQEVAVDAAASAAPVDVDESEVRSRWDSSAIRRADVGLEDQLTQAAELGDLVAAVTDADGRILWSAGGRSMRRDAERVGFVPGGRWDETSAGTNALGLALRTRRPATVFSAEHWCDAVRDWVCWSAPVIDEHGRSLGVIDLSGRWDTASPLAEVTVATLSRLVQAHLPTAGAREPARLDGVDEEGDSPLLELQLLGHPSARLGGRELALTPRQFELLAALAIIGPSSLDELQLHVYGDRPVTAATIKAELSHLRAKLGGGIGSRPYRLTLPTQVDVVALQADLDAGALADAVGRYTGSLLPDSEAPAVVDHRHLVDVELREALLAGGTSGDLLRYATVQPWDEHVLETAARRADRQDPEHHRAIARLDRARRL
ncbi:hypothetical protein [Dermatobacter hominis]|uniref:hypothetical protein n=1 Tax=Dermatobacter hominis TaxID=2884263 RepID=UPI001D11A47C|nr:hypothetical protein [Dermatobacter hominis]UDY36583.1 hypothetical protein LH044_03360 [Dermatobacter hominis]